MLDPKAYKRFNHTDWDEFVQGTEILVNENPDLTVDQLMICTHELRGYAFESKRWLVFDVNHVAHLEFNSKSFQSLMIEKEKKTMIRSLVTQHGSEGDDFDDFIEGKGRGLIFLLYGPPGVGKTFTAGK